jgi:serine/threonine protein kinase
MAPEQFRNAKNADVRCDVYSLGATLYQMLTGELPFDRGDPVQIMMAKLRNDLVPVRRLAPDVSERVERVILRAMSPDPQQRPASCVEFLDDLLGRPGAPRPAAVRPRKAAETAAMPREKLDELLSPPRPPRVNPRPAAGAGAGPGLLSEKYLPRVTLPVAPPPPAAAPTPAEPPSDSWKTLVLVLLAGAAAILLSQFLFPSLP